jgi:tripartite-type tricarboxylate transporter receptor subunit TctC
VAAILSGNVDCYWVPISAGVSNIKAGKLRALAVSTGTRSPLMPDLATTAEAGVKGAEAGLWFGLWGPAGMPAELVGKINADVRKALADPGVKEKLANTGNVALDMSPQEFARFVRSEIDDYQRVVRAAGIKPQ